MAKKRAKAKPAKKAAPKKKPAKKVAVKKPAAKKAAVKKSTSNRKRFVKPGKDKFGGFWRSGRYHFVAGGKNLVADPCDRIIIDGKKVYIGNGE